MIIMGYSRLATTSVIWQIDIENELTGLQHNFSLWAAWNNPIASRLQVREKIGAGVIGRHRGDQIIVVVIKAAIAIVDVEVHHGLANSQFIGIADPVPVGVMPDSPADPAERRLRWQFHPRHAQ